MFRSTPWTESAVILYQKAGGWFQRGLHDFTDDAARKAAFGNP